MIIKPVDKHSAAYQIICDNCVIGEVAVEVWVRTAEIYAELYAKRFTAMDSDTLITAFCIVSGHTLITSNTSDFKTSVA